MKPWRHRGLVIGLILHLAVVAAWAGRPDKAGASAAPELLIPVGARSIALAGSSLAIADGIESIFWNPAGLSRTTHGSNAMFTHMNYIADIGVEYLAVSTAFSGFGTIGISLKSLSFGDIPITTEDQPDGTGEIASPTFFVVGATYSRQLTDRIGIGVTTNLISERMERVNSTDVAFNIGVQYLGVGGVNGLSLGVAVKNIGPQMTFGGPGLLRQGQINDILQPASFYVVQAASAELPSVMEIGLGYSTPLTEGSKMNISGMFQNNNFSEDEYKVGAEYAYNDMMFVRGGYNFVSQQTGRENIFAGAFGWSFGLGFRTMLGDVDASIDYAYRAAEFFGGNNVFGVSFGF